MPTFIKLRERRAARLSTIPSQNGKYTQDNTDTLWLIGEEKRENNKSKKELNPCVVVVMFPNHQVRYLIQLHPHKTHTGAISISNSSVD